MVNRKINILTKIINLNWISKPSNLYDTTTEFDYKSRLSYYIGTIYAYEKYFNDINDLTYLISAKVTLSHLIEIEKIIILNIFNLTKSNEIFNERSLKNISTDANNIALRHLEDITNLSKHFKDCCLIYDNYPSSHYNRYIQKNLKQSQPLSSVRMILQRYLIKIQIDIELYTDVYNQSKFDLQKDENIITIPSTNTSTSSMNYSMYDITENINSYNQ